MRIAVFAVMTYVPLIVSPVQGEDIHWVGYQQGCLLLDTGIGASFHDGNQWFGFIPPAEKPPGEEDTAIFDLSFDPQDNGMPRNIHFGEYTAHFSGCSDVTSPANDVRIGHVRFEEGDFHLFLEGQTLELRFEFFDEIIGGFLSAQPGAQAFFEGPGVIDVGSLFSTGGEMHLSEQTVLAGTISAHDRDGVPGVMVVDGPANVTLGGPNGGIGILSTGPRSNLVIAGGATINHFKQIDENLSQGIKVSGDVTSMVDAPTVTISGAETAVSTNRQLGIANNPTGDMGQLFLNDGAQLSTGNAASSTQSSGIIGQTGAGRMVVKDQGTLWTQNGVLNVGFSDGASGELEVLSGANVESTDGRIARVAGSAGSVLVSGAGSSWTATGAIYVGGSETGPGGDGELSVINDGTVTAGLIQVWENGTLSGDGTILGNVDSAGNVAPGTSPGTLSVDGDLTLRAESILTMEIGDNTPGTFDQILVTGAAELGGLLELVFVDGYSPSQNDEFMLLSADRFTAAFNSIEIIGLPDGTDFTLDVNQGGVYLRDIAVPEPSTSILLVVGMLASVSAAKHRCLTAGSQQDHFTNETLP